MLQVSEGTADKVLETAPGLQQSTPHYAPHIDLGAVCSAGGFSESNSSCRHCRLLDPLHLNPAVLHLQTRSPQPHSTLKSEAFSDVSACSDTDQYRVNERPRYGPEWEASAWYAACESSVSFRVMLLSITRWCFFVRRE